MVRVFTFVVHSVFFSPIIPKTVWISWLWHYIHYLYVPLHTNSWFEPFSRLTLYTKRICGIICFESEVKMFWSGRCSLPRGACSAQPSAPLLPLPVQLRGPSPPSKHAGAPCHPHTYYQVRPYPPYLLPGMTLSPRLTSTPYHPIPPPFPLPGTPLFYFYEQNSSMTPLF